MLTDLEKTKDQDTAIKSRYDGSVDSAVLDYVIPWLACRAVAFGEGWTTESTTYCLYLIRIAMQNGKSLRDITMFFHLEARNFKHPRAGH